eukprot:gene36715-biopygen21146
MNNYLTLDPANDRYHGATHKSNNTGEVTAIGEALSWILQQPPDPVQFRKVKAHRTDNFTDSKRNREAGTLANQGRLMDLEEFGFPPDPLNDME